MITNECLYVKVMLDIYRMVMDVSYWIIEYKDVAYDY